jgi:uncharacterized protein YeaO (DUF488 family)
MTIKIKRIYEPYEKNDGYRILVDRLWPRGIKKETAHFDIWLKEVAPSTVLRKWFNHEPEKWPQFLMKYRTELKGSATLDELISLVNKHKLVTLLYGAKNDNFNQAAALKQFINNSRK